jgi:hypothetical protein
MRMAQRSARQPKASEQIVDKFWTLLKRNNDPMAAWREVHRWWCKEKGHSEQSWKSASGAAFERIAQQYVQQLVDADPRLKGQVEIKRWNQLEQDLQEGILAEQVWQKGELRKPVTVPSEVDMVALQVEGEEISRVIAAYSCKSSAAERYQQDLFWAERLRGRGIRFCFVTLDEVFLGYARHGAGKDNKSVRLAMALYDRVYLFTTEELHHGTAVFQPINNIADDLAKWLEVL